MEVLYLLILVVIIGCLVLIDKRYTLAFFYNVRRTVMTLAIAVWLLTVWNIFGITFGIFFHGGSAFTLPFRIIPEFPIEELFFLFVLSYSALLLYRFTAERLKK